MTRARLAGCVLALAAGTSAIVLGAASAHEQDERPRPVLVSSHGLAVRAGQGSFCVYQPGHAACGDYFYPLRVKGRLPVAPGRLVVLQMHDGKIARLGVALLRVEGDEIDYTGWSHLAEPVPGNPWKWRFRLPANLHDANRLDIFAAYERSVGGDSNWWAGLDPSP